MKLNDSQRETVLNALHIAECECRNDARRRSDPRHKELFTESANKYRSLRDAIEKGAEDIELPDWGSIGEP